MKELYRLARGTVRLSVEGEKPERILNYCAENGIGFFDVSPVHELAIELSIRASDHERLMCQNGRNGISITIVSTRGGKNLTRKLRRRLALCIGSGACIILLALSSLFVWSIDIEGNSTVSDSEILRLLSDCGVRYGSFRLSVSSENVRNEILLNEPRIAWMSVNIRNSRAHILIRERINKPEIIDESGVSDITASKDGVIEKLTVLSGEARVQPGQTVTKGEVLISGTVKGAAANDTETFALGEAKARTWYELTAQTPLYESRKTEVTRKKTNYSLTIGKKRIKIFADSRNHGVSCDKIIKLRELSLENVFVLPVGIIKEQYTEYETSLCRIDEAAAILRLKQTLADELCSSVDGEILNNNYSITKDEKMLTVTLRAECIESIGENHVRENDRG